MKKRDPQARAVAMGALMMASLTLCGGCLPLDGGAIETFVGDLLRSAMAAFLL